MRKNKMNTKEEKELLPTVNFANGSEPKEYGEITREATEAELIEIDLGRLLNRMVDFNERVPTNGTGTAISKLKQTILFFNKEY